MSIAASFNYYTETIDGIEVQKPLPKRLHAIIQARILRMLERQCGPEIEVLPALDMLCGTDRYVPDVAAARIDAMYRNGMLAEGPLLAIEIMSPGQTIGRLFEKCEIYLTHGASVCWVIWPKRRQAWLYTKEEVTEIFGGGYLRANAAPLHVEISVDELFANLPDSE